MCRKSGREREKLISREGSREWGCRDTSHFKKISDFILERGEGRERSIDV